MYRRIFIQSVVGSMLLISFIPTGCSPMLMRQTFSPEQVDTVKVLTEKVKVHMTDGSLYILDSLLTYESKDTIEGYGTFYDKYRDIVNHRRMTDVGTSKPAFSIPLSEVALLEVNNMKGLKGRSISMALVAVPTVLLTGYCLMNPKACFGSCPTFYTWDGQDTVLMAEGFSSSILQIFEKEDIDMLYHTRMSDNTLHLRVTNEALETHVIKQADILAFPRCGNERVFGSADGEFYMVSGILSPGICIASEGDCSDAIMEIDNKERFSSSNPDNLAEREYIEVSFSDVPSGELGLIIECRQTLLTTYLFYQGLAYLGNKAGHFAARLESGDEFLRRKVDNVWDILGGIEIFIRNGNDKWIKVDEIREMGPIASDIHLVKLPSSASEIMDIKLRLTQGLWRIGYIALGRIDRKVDPLTLKPALVTSLGNSDPESLSVPQLKTVDDQLVTLPGDGYEIRYDLPVSPCQYELFLKSRGYYLEWMRETWIEEENIRKAAIFFGFPRLYMRRAAEEFKLIEPSMELSFWNSRYVRN